MNLNRRPASLILSVLSAVTAIASYASQAHATCLTQCQGALTFKDCSQPAAPETWPLGTELSFTVVCEECCSAPGGPAMCSPTPVNEDGFWMFNGMGEDVPGTFATTDIVCDGLKLYTFDGALPLGAYYLNNMPLNDPSYTGVLLFNVVEAEMGAGGAGGAGGGSGGNGGAGGAGGEMNGSGGSGAGGGAPAGDPDTGYGVEGCACSHVTPSAGGLTWLAAASALIVMVARRARGARATRRPRAGAPTSGLRSPALKAR